MDCVISTDFTIGTTFDEAVLQEIWSRFEEFSQSEIRITGQEFLAEVEELTSSVDKEIILMGLMRNGGSNQYLDGPSLLQSTYLFDTDLCLKILEEQSVASRVTALESEESTPTSVETIVTAPPGVELAKLARPTVASLPPRLRRLILEAQSSVRIANPYFDPNEQIVEDIIALPKKGVQTQILTREVDIPDHVETFERFTEQLNDEQLGNLEIRDLYELDTTGRQETATHAKLMIVDDTIAYLGSANLTTTSLGSNFEIGALIRGPPVADIAAVFDMVFSTADQVQISSDA